MKVLRVRNNIDYNEFEGEKLDWTNVDGTLRIFVNDQATAEFSPGSWQNVVLFNKATGS